MQRRIESFLNSQFLAPITLLAIAILAYGLLVSQLGFYWDDLPISWIRYQLGTQAMTVYFSNNRPVWALLYQITTRILPDNPTYWQVFALLLRWLTSYLFYLNLKRVFPYIAFAASLLFLVFTGFNGHWASFLFSHFYLVLSFFLISFLLMMRNNKLTVLALIFAALNLWMMEYFFVLELTRGLWIWACFRNESAPRARLIKTFRLWTPYLILFTLAVLSRIFIFNNQVYSFSLTAELANAPLQTLTNLMGNIFVSLWNVTLGAIIQAFQLPSLVYDGSRTTIIYCLVFLLVELLSYFSLRALANQQKLEPKSLTPIFIGLLMLPFAGIPFWLTGVPVSLSFPASRAVLPFMLGSSLLFAGLLHYFFPNIYKLVLAVLIGLSAGRQFLWSNEFRRDWQSHNDLFWQMTWRAPSLKPGTIVLMNEYLLKYADNSIGATLNWIYAPDNHSNVVDYVLFYPTNRLGGSLSSLEPNQPVNYDYLAGQFRGNTSQIVAFYYDPPRCLRLLDPEIDPDNHMISDESYLRDAAKLSSTSSILPDTNGRIPAIMSPEPAHTWCYYFETADLARQFKNWTRVVSLGDVAFSLADHPNDPIERFVFIEGYAHTEQWKKAVELSKVSYKVSKNFVGPPLCKLWDRIERETTDLPDRESALQEVRSSFGCTP